ncbi:bifunctional lysylphosphatidylglycerol synthetase/lysine--tRNA ligase LysX [Gordonia sp. TBRC 11910]|uniref:Lysine--tRNA ligase n=1 Tax=Gordonia asplenii TaxID=2725283 RepID=A0A848L4R5_9ACTN|nr:bifunctional lysylphosphatidylglycerol synthetase/lysine--tRNA ligase LysX [Gordonia asplenii]NMO04035.1 bifunctional lysylphosphatidylglycerol synthetase/lysine--tRNA ligase LysX [Gordonia asplenii]
MAVDTVRAREANWRSNDLIEHIRRPRGFGADAPRIAATVLGVLAGLSLASSILPPFRRLIHVPRDFIDSFIISMPDTSFAWAFVLAMVAIALGRRKRMAWWIFVGYLVLFMASNVVYLFDPIASQFDVDDTERISIYVGLGFDVVALAFLIVTYRQFYTRVRRGAGLAALAVLFGGLAVATLIGWGLVMLFPRDLQHGERLAYALNRVVAFGSVDSRTFDGHHTYPPINGLLGLFGALALMAAAVVLLRSQRLKSFMTVDDERLVRALITTFNDDDSLAYFSTRRDKAVVFAPDGRAAITYRVELSVGVAGGDPIGDPQSWPAAIEAFLTLCDRYGWHPSAMGASSRGAQAYHLAGFSSLSIGDEAILHTAGFSLNGPTMKSVRQAVTRAKRAGIGVRIRRHSELSDAERAEMVSLADQWRDTEDERGFAMALGRLGDDQDGNCLLVEAVSGLETDHPKVVGMLSFVPWGRTGVSLDVMRRDRESVNGIVELMVSELARNAEDVGVTDISLNFATFRAFFEQGSQIGAGPVMRLSYSVLMFGSKFFQMESLYKSNAKYFPDWVPRYLCYEDSRMIPRVGLASVVAEGFITLPSLTWRRRQYVAGQSSVPAGVDLGALLVQLDVERVADKETSRRPEQVRVRMAKLQALRDKGIDPYPVADPPSHTVVDAMSSEAGTGVVVAGRVTRVRDFGGVVFAQLHDWSGEVQVLVEPAALRPGTEDFAASVDLGDLISVTGPMGTSRTGVTSVLATSWTMIGKCLHPLPDKWSGLTDPESRVRQRYVDLAINADSRRLLKTRSTVVRALRDFLDNRDFIEVETPILQRIHGGANATPFLTHINAYNLDLYLRIAPELYLKRLCVGGVERVFEIGRNFRNEGVDFSHNPEFTSLEAYEAHSDYRKMLDLTRDMIQYAATAVHGSPKIVRTDDAGEREWVDISGQWPVRSVYDVVTDGVGVEVTPSTTVEELREHSARVGVPIRPTWDAGQIVQELYEHFGEALTTTPTFYIDFPSSVSPLTRPHRSIDGVSERWDLVAWGVELGTAYTELTDPVEQRRRLTAQSLLAAGGDPEAMEIDEDFLQALEYAMPPTGGLGLGVDRIAMLITGQSIRESLAFPLVKPV